ncbi:MAG TPA: hypothetical protein VFG69_16975 [Nannocystaceae bacterium]|nr:hypothetical protein [Nannocystaceae bacterium]
MTDIAQFRRTLVERILEGGGWAAPAERRAAFADRGLEEPVSTLAHKVAQRSRSVTDADVAAVRAAGYDEDRIFELVVCAAVGQAVRVHDRALVALTAAAAFAEK